VKRSRLVKQRLTFTLGRRLRRHNTFEPEVSTSISGRRNIQRTDEEDGEDNKGENPLQGNDLDIKLFDSQCYYRSVISNERKG
jgi:hypothetical protein